MGEDYNLVAALKAASVSAQEAADHYSENVRRAMMSATREGPSVVTDVAAFVLARLAEREQAARTEMSTPGWNEYDPEDYNSPARVLAEVAALRAVVEVVVDHGGSGASEWIPYDKVLRALARIWADHPDYDPAWGA